MFDDIEGEVIKPAETPHGDGQQQPDFQRRLLEDQQGRSHQPDDKEQKAFELDQAWRGDVFHGQKRDRNIQHPISNIQYPKSAYSASNSPSFDAARSHSAVRAARLSMTALSSRLICIAAPGFSYVSGLSSSAVNSAWRDSRSAISFSSRCTSCCCALRSRDRAWRSSACWRFCSLRDTAPSSAALPPFETGTRWNSCLPPSVNAARSETAAVLSR